MTIYILLGFLVIVCLWDIKTFEIPNFFYFTGLLLGFVFRYLDKGWSGVFSSFISFLIVFAITFAIWIVGEIIFGASIIGGGDMKLLMVISTFLGVSTTIQIFYWSIVLAGFLFIFMIYPKQIFRLFQNIFYFFVYAIPKTSISTKKLAFSVPITLTTAYFLLYFK